MFLTFCLCGMTVFLFSFIGNLLHIAPTKSLSMSLQVTMAITPTIWIARNKNMREKFLKMTGFWPAEQDTDADKK